MNKHYDMNTENSDCDNDTYFDRSYVHNNIHKTECDINQKEKVRICVLFA